MMRKRQCFASRRRILELRIGWCGRMGAASVRIKFVKPTHQRGLSRELLVTFPFMYFKDSADLIDPGNTSTVYEYYLLENLGLGLVRDSPASLGGYSPGLAVEWAQESKTLWRFQIRKDLRWSDGSLLSIEQMVMHFEDLKNRPSRHLSYLKNLESAFEEPETHELILKFRVPTGVQLLHELSLADAVLYKSRPLDWSVTSGPYRVAKFDWTHKILELERNDFCPLVSETSPMRIRLFGLESKEQTSDLFGAIPVDIYTIRFASFHPIYEAPKQAAAQMLEGMPSSIYYFAFNAANTRAQDTRLRKIFAHLVNEALAGQKLPRGLAIEHQMIPQGYSGRLPEYKPLSMKQESLGAMHLKILLWKDLEPLDSFFRLIQKMAMGWGLKLEWVYCNHAEILQTQDAFAHFYSFSGNQKDALGSWRFLFSEGHGPLSLFSREASSLLQKIVDEPDSDRRSEALLSLHQRVLDEAWAVPFMCYRPVVLASERVNLSRWNPFDLRLRFYELSWNQ